MRLGIEKRVDGEGCEIREGKNAMKNTIEGVGLGVGVGVGG